MATHSSAYGEIELPQSEGDLISRFLKNYGEWAALETAFVASVLKPGSRVLDVGGFIGTFSLGLRRHLDLSYVCAVEANRDTFPLLERNLKRLLRCKFDALSGLVAPAESTALIGRTSVDNAGATSFAPGAKGDIEVASPDQRFTLSSLITEKGPFDLVKLDIEGMELDVLTTTPLVMEDDAPALWVECNESSASIEVARYLLQSGRPLWYFAFPSHNPNNHNGEAQPIYPHAYEAGLLLGPASPSLSAELTEADCILRPVFSIVDLQAAMWRTPRWGEAEWGEASRAELMGMLTHLTVGGHEQDFLRHIGEGKLPITEMSQTKRRLSEMQLRADAFAASLAEQFELRRERERFLDQFRCEVDQLRSELHAVRLEAEREADQLRSELHAVRLEAEREADQLRSELHAVRLEAERARQTIPTLELSAASEKKRVGELKQTLATSQKRAAKLKRNMGTWPSLKTVIGQVPGAKSIWRRMRGEWPSFRRAIGRVPGVKSIWRRMRGE